MNTPFEVAVVAASWQAAGLDVWWSQGEHLPLPSDPPVVVFGTRADTAPRLNAAQRRLGSWIRLPAIDYAVVDLSSNVYGLSLDAQRRRLAAVLQNTYKPDERLADALGKYIARHRLASAYMLPEDAVRRFAFWLLLIWDGRHQVPRIGA